MAAAINTARIVQFSAAVHVAAQQMQSRFAGMFEVKQMVGKAMAYDGVGSIEAQEVNGRFRTVQFSDLQIKRRKIGTRQFTLTIPIDENDAEQILMNQEAEYARACTMAMARVYDRIGLEAAVANVLTGEEFDTSVSFATDGGLTVNATAGLTYEKLLEIGQNFMDNDVGTDMIENFIFCISGDEHTALMGETQLTSGDYVRQFNVEKGSIQDAVGFKLVKFAANAVNPLLSVAAGVRTCLAMSTRALCYAMPKQFELKVQDRTDLIRTRQVQVNWTLGAVRTEGVLVQKVTTTD